jgi:hypothetical protein
LQDFRSSLRIPAKNRFLEVFAASCEFLAIGTELGLDHCRVDESKITLE